jgi:CrcB protein
MALMMSFFLVAAGGALGACARYGVGVLVGGGAWPSGTFFVNILGGFLMGVLAGWLAARGGMEGVRLFLGVGVLGGFTTFSAFSLEVALMLEQGALNMAFAYALLSVMLSVAALFAGLWVVRMVF